MILAIAMLVGLLIVLLLVLARTSWLAKKRGWKITKSGNSLQKYSELDAKNNWRSITFECKMYSKGVPRHAIIIDQNWSNYPSWARDKKDEILLRLKRALKEPTYTFLEENKK